MATGELLPTRNCNPWRTTVVAGALIGMEAVTGVAPGVTRRSTECRFPQHASGEACDSRGHVLGHRSGLASVVAGQVAEIHVGLREKGPPVGSEF